jgi:hypothetical protein
METEFPGFLICDHTTFFYKCKFPSLSALNIEKRLKMQVNGFKAKYGTYVRIVVLEKHDNILYNDIETIVIYNYLHKFDIIATLPVVEEMLNGGQLECCGS